MLPDTRRVVIIGGASPNDRYYLSIAGSLVKEMNTQLEFEFSHGVPLDKLTAQVSEYEAGTVLFILTYSLDASSKSYITDFASSEIAKSAKVPLFSILEKVVEDGATGACTYPPSQYAMDASELTNSIFLDESTAIESETKISWVFDAKKLERFKISQNKLPKGSRIINTDDSLWGSYKAFILAGGFVILSQMALILMMFFENAKRKRSDRELGRSQQKFHTVFEKSPAYKLIIGNDNFTILNANDNVKNILSIDPTGLSVYDVFEASSIPLIEGIITGRDLLDSTSSEYTIQFRNSVKKCYIVRRVVIVIDSVPHIILQMIDVNEKSLYRKLLVELNPLYCEIMDISELLRDAIEDVRKISRNYYPAKLLSRGFLFCVSELVEYIRSVYDVSSRVNLQKTPLLENQDVIINLYYITLEAINNSIRHGRASEIRIFDTFSHRKYIYSISDNGTGFNHNKKSDGIGLEIMRCRSEIIKAAFVLQANKPHGTTIQIKFKIEEKSTL